jgi:hypothetical protein
MRTVGAILLGAVLVVGTACARRGAHAIFPNLAIPVSCASEITLLECDARVTPPKCRSARVKYKSGCEEIVVGK